MLTNTIKEKLFECPFCGRALKSSDMLLDHMDHDHRNWSAYVLSSDHCESEELDGILRKRKNKYHEDEWTSSSKEITFNDKVLKDGDATDRKRGDKSIVTDAEVICISDSEEVFNAQQSDRREVDAWRTEECDDGTTYFSAVCSISKSVDAKTDVCEIELSRRTKELFVDSEICVDHSVKNLPGPVAHSSVDGNISFTEEIREIPSQICGDYDRLKMVHLSFSAAAENNIKSKKRRSRASRRRKEHNNKIIIANVPCNKDWVSLASRNSKKALICLEEDDEIRSYETESESDPFSDSEQTQYDGEIEIVDSVVHNTEIIEEKAYATEDIICLGNKSKGVFKESTGDFSSENVPDSTNLVCNQFCKGGTNISLCEVVPALCKTRINEKCSQVVSENDGHSFESKITEDDGFAELTASLEKLPIEKCHNFTNFNHSNNGGLNLCTKDTLEHESNKYSTTFNNDFQLRIEDVYHIDEWETDEVGKESVKNSSFQNSENCILIPTFQEKENEFIPLDNHDFIKKEIEIEEHPLNVLDTDHNILQESLNQKNNFNSLSHVKLAGLNPYKCSHCLFACKSKENLVLHIRRCFRRRKIRDRIGKEVNCGSESVKCFLCSYQLGNNFRLIQHLFRVHADIVNTPYVRSEILSVLKITDESSSNISRDQVVANVMKGMALNSSSLSDQVTGINIRNANIPKSKCTFCRKQIHQNHSKPHVRKCIAKLCLKENIVAVAKSNTSGNQEGDMERLPSNITEGHKYRCLICIKVFNRLHYFYEHLFSHTPFKPYECTFCKKGFLKRRLKTHHIKNCRDRSYCPKSHKGLLGSTLLSKDASLVKSNKDGQVSHDTASKKVDTSHANHEKLGLLSCKICCKSFERLIDFKNHRSCAHEELKCLYCLEIFDDKINLKYHTRKCRLEFHPKNMYKVRSDKEKYEYNAEKITEEEFRCHYCLNEFDNKINLKRHTVKCKFEFLQENIYDRSIASKMHHGIEKASNSLKNRTYNLSTSSSSGGDLIGNGSSESYPCSLCEREFRSYYNLYCHKLVIHNGILHGKKKKKNLRSNARRCICKICGKEFPRGILKFHVRDCFLSRKRNDIHKSQNKVSSDISREKYIHRRKTGTRNKRYIEKSDVLHDFIGFTKPYVCVYCRKEFSDSFCFSLHKSKHFDKHQKYMSKKTYDLVVKVQKLDNILVGN